MRLSVLLSVASLIVPASALAIINVGSDGSDNVLSVTTNTTIDLSQAPAAVWSTPAPTPGKGVYDATQWAVIFKYDSVYVAPNVTLTFTDNKTNAPVVWLVKRGVWVRGTISLRGADTPSAGLYAIPGPGGFQGGRSRVSGSTPGSAGFGPGGGQYKPGNYGSGGSYGTLGVGACATCIDSTYGNSQMLPLIGGSGGSGYDGYTGAPGGGAGGGAILIAAGDSVSLTGSITVKGGSGADLCCTYYRTGAGSGGGIRLAGDVVKVAGTLDATGGSGPYVGGDGRVRLDFILLSISGAIYTSYTTLQPLPADGPAIWPSTSAPVITVSTIGGVAVPTDPSGNFTTGDLSLAQSPSIPIVLTAQNVPTNSRVTVFVKLASGQDVNVMAQYQTGSQSLSTWLATATNLPSSGFTSIQARAQLP